MARQLQPHSPVDPAASTTTTTSTTSTTSHAAPPHVREQVKYNSQTGRPVRVSAGRKTVDSSYVDISELANDEFEDALGLTTSEEEDADEDEDPYARRKAPSKKQKKPKAKKRKRSPSPPPPPLSPVREDLPDFHDSEDDIPLAERMIASSVPSSPSSRSSHAINLTFHVPRGFQGPFVVKLDSAFLAQAHHGVQPQNASDSSAAPSSKRRSSKRRSSTTSSTTSDSTNNRTASNTARSENASLSGSSSERSEPAQVGFLSLPPELRNKVYRLLFVQERPLNFWDPDNFCRSSAFLRTCKQVNEEGCGILYGENAFRFVRNRSMRGQYWDAKSTEIGYKDMRRFLEGIGTNNRARLRSMTVVFEDAAPSSAPHLLTTDERRFVHDGQLLECLRIIGRDCQLKSMFLCFQGRRSLDESYTFHKFLDILSRIKADEVDIVKDPRTNWSHSIKVTYPVKISLVREMTRKKKLYAVA